MKNLFFIMPHGPNKMLLIYQLLSYPRDLNFREKIGGVLLVVESPLLSLTCDFREISAAAEI